MAFRFVSVFCVGLLAVAVSGQQAQYGNDAYIRDNQYQAGNFQAVNGGGAAVQQVAVGGGVQGGPKVHEIHTTSEREVIRVEEYKRPRQIIRIHEQPAPEPEIIRVQAPPEPQKVIRVVQRSRPVRVRFQAQPEVQEVTVPIRQVVQRVRPVVYQHHVQAAPVVQTRVHTVQAAPVQYQTVQAAPVVQTRVHTVQAAPVQYQTVQAAPVQYQTIQAAAPVQYQTVQAAPVATRFQTVSSPSFVYNSAPAAVAAPAYTQTQTTYGQGFFQGKKA